jgi:outer membrane protein assembly factor BamB
MKRFHSRNRQPFGVIRSKIGVIFSFAMLLSSSDCVAFQAEQVDSAKGINSLWTTDRGSDWPTFLGPTADGKSPETGIRTDWSDGKLPVVWRTSLAEGYGIGSVCNGRYVHFDRHRGRARVRCFHAETGRGLWEFQYPSTYVDLYGYDSGPRASPVFDENRVYVFGVEGMLHCLDAESGNVIWKVDTKKEFGVIQNFFGVASTPVVHDEWLLTMVGGSPRESQKVPPGQLDRVQPNGSGIVAFDKRTGRIAYRVGNDLASYTTIKLALVGTKKTGLAWLRDSLIGFDPNDGTELFQYGFRSRKLESVNASTPVVSPPHVLLSECYGLGSVLLNVDASTPQVIWTDRNRRSKSLEAHWNTPILVDGMVYACSGRHASNAQLRCIELATGDVNWSKDGFARTSLTFIDGHLIVMDERGRLCLIKANSNRYELVTEYDGGPDNVRFKSPCWAAPIVSHGLMFTRGRDELVCFELIPKQR